MTRDEAISKAITILRGFDGISAVGLSGSSAHGNPDEMSDLDIAIFASRDVPSPEVRQRHYTTCGISAPAYFNVDFEISRGDGLQIDGVDCGFIWMSLPKAEAFLQALAEDFNCDEFLPGGLVTMRPLVDPDGVIPALHDSIPSYPEARAEHRIKKNLKEAYFSIYVLAWLHKAAMRKDCFSFLKNEFEVLDSFFAAVFALNRRWYSHEKRLTQIVREFDMAPPNAAARIETIIMHKDSCEDLSRSEREIKALFSDLANISNKTFPGLDVPTDWK